MTGQQRNEKRKLKSGVPDPRRTIVFVLAVTLIAGSVASWWYGEKGSGTFATAAMGRIGLVMSALWLAWPSLRRPASWLPPGIPVLGVVALGVVAANPRLVIVIIPALSALIALAAMVRVFRRSS